MATDQAGIRRIETVGALVRGEYGNLARISGVEESTRCSPDHVSSPLDVVVNLQPEGPGYRHRTAWASTLTLAQPGDRGAHPHYRDCVCGEPYDETRGGYWYHVPASWQS